ncbi:MULTISPECIES: hypothetical protein [unclassified Streptomyces]|uniref:YncE family protein n=1 Tax=unclassified Streptomyces TaxID=2593676 RepID=UPI001EEFEE95|nr:MULTISPECIES: hypothetical protein [unclassified Streptomyces]
MPDSEGLAVSADGTHVCVAAPYAGSSSASAEGGPAMGEIEVGHVPLTITSSPDGRLAYVACVASSTVDIIDLETLKRLARLDIPKHGEAGAHGMAYIPRPA